MNFRSLPGLALVACAGLNLAHAQQSTVSPGQLDTPPSATPFVTRTTESQNPVSPAIQRRESAKRTLWYVTIAAAVGATTFDSASSWQKHELNPLLASSNGTFGGRAVGIKIGAAAVTLLPQFILRKHKDLRTGFILGNLAQTAIYSGGAIHNLNMK
jgi:hypothetical protein